MLSKHGSLPLPHLLTSISLDTNSVGLWPPRPASHSIRTGVHHWIMVLQAKEPCPEATARWIWEWKTKPGFSDGLSLSLLGSVHPLRVRMGSPEMNHWDRRKVQTPQRTFTLAQVHDTLGFLGFLLPSYPIHANSALVVSPVAFLLGWRPLSRYRETSGWGKQPSQELWLPGMVTGWL